MKRVYPVVLSPDKEEGGYIVSVPDLNIDTQGEDMADAINMARDAIGLWGITAEERNKNIPTPSMAEPPHESNEIITWVDIDFLKYRKAHDTRAVHKNVTIPAWMAHAAAENGLNLSRELQTALQSRYEELGIRN